jgi:hypothetical protein
MDKHELEVFIEVLQNSVNTSEEMWRKEISHAEIIGYLQGSIKGTVTVLKDKRRLLNEK